MKKSALLVAQIGGAHKIHHTPVLNQVVLQRVAGEHDAALGADALQALGDVGRVVLDAVTFVADHKTGREERFFDVLEQNE